MLRLVYGQKEDHQNPVASLEDLLKVFDLKPLPSKLTRAKSDCQSILRVLNRVAKQFKVKCEIDPNSKMPSLPSPPVASPTMTDEPKETEVGLKNKDKDKVVE